jgi:hypothetical protein
MSKNPQIVTGNAITESHDTRGWFVGAFIKSAGELQTTNEVEVKWGQHQKGESRESLAATGDATTLGILISGKFAVKPENGDEIVLSQPGDYIMWQPNIPHLSIAYEDSLIITVRWPSLFNKRN